MKVKIRHTDDVDGALFGEVPWDTDMGAIISLLHRWGLFVDWNYSPEVISGQFILDRNNNDFFFEVLLEDQE